MTDIVRIHHDLDFQRTALLLLLGIFALAYYARNNASQASFRAKEAVREIREHREATEEEYERPGY